MKRSTAQKKLARVARQLVDSYAPGQTPLFTGKANVYAFDSDGQPITTMGYLAFQLGFSKKLLVDTQHGVATVAKLLDVDPSGIPTEVRQAIVAIRDIEIQQTNPYNRRRKLVAALTVFAAAIGGAYIRKPYVKSGLFTADARQAGTFGKSPAATTQATI